MSTQNNTAAAYPLAWPAGRPRATHRKNQTRFQATFATARDSCRDEVRQLGATSCVISTNIELKANGEPYSVKFGAVISDPGVAVYFTRQGKQMCFACDCWNHVQDNMHAVALTIRALRGIARWGTGDMMEAAFRGFRALPEQTSSSWYSVLCVSINATLEQAQDAYRVLVKKYHPDVVGGDAEMFRRVNEAWNEVRGQLK